MKRLFKTDIREAVSKRYVNQAGFLVLPDCVIARSGILEYGDVETENGDLIANGEVIPVYRPKSAIESCVSQFANLPLTLGHPDEQKVDPENAKQVVVGAIGSKPRIEERDGEDYIIADIIVYDKDAIESVQNGEFTELSAGYETSFSGRRGDQDGRHYEAVQFLLIPNHVALVRQGRCGSECKVCDESVVLSTNVKQKEAEMKQKYRYMLQVADGIEPVELTEEQAEEMIKDSGNEVVEMTEEEAAKLDGCGGKKKDEEEEEFTKTEEDPDFTEEEEFRKTEEETGDEGEEETEKVSDFVYEVEFDDGTTGKMDENTYKHLTRYLDVQKKGDAMQEVARMTVLTAQANRVLGDAFDVSTYVKGDAIDTDRIKKDVIRKVMPSLVVKSLKGDALDHIYKTAIDSYDSSKARWTEDVAALGKRASATDSAASPLASAREAYLKRMSGKKSN